MPSKLQSLSLTITCAALAACGTISKPPVKKATAAAVVSGAGLTVGSCTAFQGNTASVFSNEYTAFSACATSDAATVELTYANDLAGNNYCVMPASGSTIISQSVCFTLTNATGSTFVQFPGQSFTSVYMVRASDVDSFMAALGSSAGSFPDWVSSQLR